ncbi:4-hydroxy-3-methylbut-2-enyl diphosphate reductase [Chloroflexota bacterium]
MKIEKAAGIGFCFGVMRAINIVKKISRERDGVETLGAVVHNQPVLQKLAEIGITVVDSVAEIKDDVVVVSAHGISEQVETDIRARQIDIINTTCPFVRRAQEAARRLNEAEFFTIVYGAADHPEVKGILGRVGGRGLATLSGEISFAPGKVPHRIGVLSQTTQIPANFNHFVKQLIDSVLIKDSELRIIDTICHDIRQRQVAALELASRVDLMLVIGGNTSANSHHLADLCSTVVETHLVETKEGIQPSWLRGRNHIGITAGASTDDETIEDIANFLETIV